MLRLDQRLWRQMSVCACVVGVVGAAAHANWWYAGRATGTSFGSATNTFTNQTFDASQTPAGREFGESSPSQARAGGSGTTSGGIGGASNESVASASLEFAASLEPLPPPGIDPPPSVLTTLLVSFNGNARFSANPNNAPVTNYLGSIGSSVLVNFLEFRVTGASAVPYSLTIGGDVTQSTLSNPLEPIPVPGTGAAVVGNTLLPGRYVLPSVSAGVSAGNFQGSTYRNSFVGEMRLVLNVPTPGVAMVLGMGGVLAMRRRR